MKALMKTAPGEGHFEICEIPKPQIQKDTDVLIRVCAAGVCATDIHVMHNTFQNYPPVVIGHEFSGIVEAVGSAVTNVKVGDRVVGEPHTKACGICHTCRLGKIQNCTEKRSPGWGIDGADTDYLIFPEPHLLHKVPDNVSNLVAALAEPMAIVTHSVLERGVVEPQSFVAVVGAGPIGILAAFVAKAGGAAKTCILGIDADEKLRFPAARALGVDYAINTQKQNAVEEILRLTNGRGADMVIEASGSEGGINTAIDILKKFGKLTVIGIPGRERVSVQWKKLTNLVADISFCMSSSYSSWDRALSIMATTPYDLSKIITHQESVENWEKVYDDIAKGDAIKAMFVPSEP